MPNRLLNLKSFGEPIEGITYIDRPGAYGLILNSEDKLAIVETSHGLFLPGGGLSDDELALDALEREVLEEIGFDVISARFLGEAAQYHWSEHYQKHFKKIGTFFEVLQYANGAGSRPQVGHRLLWLSRDDAKSSLTQEFQRWAVEHFQFGFSQA